MESNDASLDLKELGAKELKSFTEDELRRLGKSFIDKAKNCGYVGLKNHGLQLDFVKDYHDATGKFFDLPTDVKMKNVRDFVTYQGYSDGTIENLALKIQEGQDVKEVFDVTSLELPLPQSVPEIKTVSANCFEILTPFVHKLFRIIELGMDWPQNFLNNLHTGAEKGIFDLRALKYPPVPGKPLGTIRCGRHADNTTLTLQFHDDADGFQIFNNNEWVDGNKDPNVITCFFGGLMTYISGNEIKATVHRVIATNDAVYENRTRLSMIVFVVPDRDQEFQSISGPVKNPLIKCQKFLEETFAEYYSIKK